MSKVYNYANNLFSLFPVKLRAPEKFLESLLFRDQSDEMKPQKIMDKPQQGSVVTWYETTSWPFLLREKSSIFPLCLSEKAIFTAKQHYSVCSKAKLPNWPKSECKLRQFTMVQVSVRFLSSKKHGSKTTNHMQSTDMTFGTTHETKTLLVIGCNFFRSQMRCLPVLCLIDWFCLLD